MNEIQNAMMDVGIRMKEFSASFIAQIFEVESLQRGRFLGSGTFVQLGKHPYLLTAAHVPNEARVHSWGHSLGDEIQPAQIPNSWHCRSHPSDLAIARLDDAHFTGDYRVRALDPRFFANQLGDLEGDFLFIHGWPGERSKEMWSLANGIASTSLPYTTLVGESSRDWFRDEIHFAIEYRVEDQRDERGSCAHVPSAEGLSGATVWKTNWSDHRDAWTPEKARIIGVAFDWDTDGGNLTCTRVEAVRCFVNEILRREGESFRWEERGSPEKDDWGDWFITKMQEV